MQRLHGWFDQLTARRRPPQKEISRRIGSRSVAPSCRLNTEIQNKPVLKRCPVPSPQMNNNIMVTSTSSFRKIGIRTNPWVSPRDYQYGRNDEMSDSICSLDRRPPSLAVKSIDSSTYSSGYASQDCSPASSCHLPSWQHGSIENRRNSPKWKDQGIYSLERKPESTRCYYQQRSHNEKEEEELQYASANSSNSSIYDNITEEHIYHELELACRRPERSYSSECLSSECADSPQPRADSPIYAQPWNHYPLILHNKSFNVKSGAAGAQFVATNKGPMGAAAASSGANRVRRRLPETPMEHIYAQPNVSRVREENAFSYGGSFFNRVEKQSKSARVPKTLELAEEEFLSELNAQINELQQRSCELRTIVERERARRGGNQPQAYWSRPTLECTFELDL